MAQENVIGLPVWKKDATAEERFLELAQMARENPGRFEKVIIAWLGTWKGRAQSADYVTTGCNAIEALGLATLARRQVENSNIE